MSSEDRRATYITLVGHDPILSGAANITLIVPRGGLEGVSLSDRELAYPPSPLVASIYPLRQVGPSGPTNSYNPRLYGHDPDDIGNKGYSFVFQDFPPSCWAI